MGSRNLVQLFQVIEEMFQQPPLTFNPANHSLKLWAMYCLRDRGFKVVYAQNADFAIETRGGEKIYCKVTHNADNLDGKYAWVVLDSSSNTASFIPPQGTS